MLPRRGPAQPASRARRIRPRDGRAGGDRGGEGCDRHRHAAARPTRRRSVARRGPARHGRLRPHPPRHARLDPRDEEQPPDSFRALGRRPQRVDHQPGGGGRAVPRPPRRGPGDRLVRHQRRAGGVARLAGRSAAGLPRDARGRADGDRVVGVGPRRGVHERRQPVRRVRRCGGGSARRRQRAGLPPGAPAPRRPPAGAARAVGARRCAGHHDARPRAADRHAAAAHRRLAPRRRGSRRGPAGAARRPARGDQLMGRRLRPLHPLRAPHPLPALRCRCVRRVRLLPRVRVSALRRHGLARGSDRRPSAPGFAPGPRRAERRSRQLLLAAPRARARVRADRVHVRLGSRHQRGAREHGADVRTSRRGARARRP